MPRPIRATICSAALAHNLEVARSRARGAKVWAVVKANAYGHGIERTYAGLQRADGFAVLDFDEAARIRDCGWSGPILLLEGFFEAGDLQRVNALGLTPMIHSDEQLDLLEGGRFDRPIDVYVKLNSGMNRLGFRADTFARAVERLRALPSVRSIAFATHFANADRAEGIDAALREFERAVDEAPGARSLSNSAATLMHSERQGNPARQWVRAGVMLYGGTPVADRDASSFDLKPAMQLRSQLIAMQTVGVGESVGYGSLFVAQRPTRIGVVACGYADGYPRHAPNGTPVWIDGTLCPIAGRVSMDMITVDVTDAPHARVGSPVELWGKCVPIDDVAHRAGTIGYELMCALAPRVPVDVDHRPLGGAD